MIYGHIPEWMVKEKPAFARAVARYYSIEHGQRKAAARGELAHWQVAEKVADRSPSALLYSLSVRARIGRAVREGDQDFLRSLHEVGRLSAKPDHGKEPPMIEHIFEAFFFLRKRDREGSPLPPKQEVKNTAAIIAAFHVEGLTAKLPGFLWRGVGLTEKEFRQVERLRRRFVDHRNHHWPRRLAEAGLSDLPRKKPALK